MTKLPTDEQGVTVRTPPPPHPRVVWVTVEQVQHPRTVWTYLLSGDEPGSARSAVIHSPSIPTVRLCRSYTELCASLHTYGVTPPWLSSSRSCSSSFPLAPLLSLPWTLLRLSRPKTRQLRTNSASQPKEATQLLKTNSACCITKARGFPRTISERSSGLKRARSRGMREPKPTSARCISRERGLRKATRWRCSG